jgi:putative NIF3 family GTP cyclohydrolase 1 type 2
MTTATDIIEYVTGQTGHPLRGDEGVHVGSATREINGVTVAWMATAEAIRSAGERGDDLFIGHESLYYPYDVLQMSDPPADWREWPINRKRSELLEQYEMSFLRLHGSLDELCILEEFANRLDLGKPVCQDGWVRIHEIEPCSFDELIIRVKRCIGMPALRVARPPGPERPVRRIGLTWGGMGLFVNVAFQQQLVEQKCDVFIGGESDCYAFRFATECGIGVIETSHEHSEIPGLRRFTSTLAGTFPDIRFAFLETPAVWRISGQD